MLERHISKWVTIVLLGTGPSLAAAQCASPNGVAGEFNYQSGVYRVCDGASWSSMADATAASGACSPAGAISFSGGPRYCNGSLLYQTMAGTETGASCAGTPNGTMQYSPTLKYMQWCNGTNWKPMRNPASSITYVQQVTISAAGGATSYNSSTFPASVTAGNGIICGITTDNTINVTGVTLTGGQAFSNAIGPIRLTGGASSYWSYIYFLANANAGTGKRVTVTTASTSGLMDLQCWEYSGLATSNMLDATTSVSATGTTVSTTVTTNSSKELLVLYANNDNSLAGTTAGWNVRAASIDGILLADKPVSTVGSQTVSVTHSNGGSNTTMLVATFRTK